MFGELSSSEEEEAEFAAAAAAEAGATGDSAAEGAAAAAALGDEDDFEKYAALLDSQLAADAVPAVPADALLATEQLGLDPSASGAVDSPLAKSSSRKPAIDQSIHIYLFVIDIIRTAHVISAAIARPELLCITLQVLYSNLDSVLMRAVRARERLPELERVMEDLRKQVSIRETALGDVSATASTSGLPPTQRLDIEILKTLRQDLSDRELEVRRAVQYCECCALAAIY